jgi:hypothetical protein
MMMNGRKFKIKKKHFQYFFKMVERNKSHCVPTAIVFALFYVVSTLQYNIMKSYPNPPVGSFFTVVV